MAAKPKSTTANRHELVSRLSWVRVGDMRISPFAQRDFNPNNPAITEDFDPELIGHPVASQRGAHYYILDGQHRVEGFRRWVGEGASDQQLLCRVYADLTEDQEADLFLKLNNNKAVGTFDKFRVGVNAGRDVETDIDRIVRSVGLKVSKHKGTEGAIGAVGTLRKVYTRGGPATLSRTLRIVRDAYGDAGLDAPVIDGVGLVCSRFNGELDDERAVERLSSARGGVGGLMNMARTAKLSTSSTLPQCVAATVVTQYNRGKGGKKLPSWWKAVSVVHE